MSVEPWSPEAFEDRYAAAADPWSFATSPYEGARYEAITAQLGSRRFRAAYEPACSVGVLSERLAPYCDHLLATDVSPTAVVRAAERCGGLANVEVRVASITEPPPAPLDLIVMSEVGYYFTLGELDPIISSLADALAPDGLLVACHWRGHSPDHQLHGSDVHARLDALLDGPLRHRSQLVEPGYLLDAWVAR